MPPKHRVGFSVLSPYAKSLVSSASLLLNRKSWPHLLSTKPMKRENLALAYIGIPTLCLAYLKLAHFPAMSWWVVALPILLPILLVMSIIAIFLLIDLLVS